MYYLLMSCPVLANFIMIICFLVNVIYDCNLLKATLKYYDIIVVIFIPIYMLIVNLLLSETKKQGIITTVFAVIINAVLCYIRWGIYTGMLHEFVLDYTPVIILSFLLIPFSIAIGGSLIINFLIRVIKGNDLLNCANKVPYYKDAINKKYLFYIIWILFIIVFLAIVLLLCIMNGNIIDPREFTYGEEESNAVEVTFEQLINQGDIYDECLIRVSGFCIIQYEGNALYISKEAYKDMSVNNGLKSIWLDIHTGILNDNSVLLRRVNKRHITVEGIYDADLKGHFSLFGGTLKNINHVEIYKSNVINLW